MTTASLTQPSEAGSAISAEERAALVEAVRDFADARLAPFANQRDADKEFPVETLREAGALGLGAMVVREDVGGSGLGRADASALYEELARGDVAVAAYISIHNMVAWMIDTFGTDEQRRAWLPRLCSMEHLASYCLTEPGAGSDAAALATSAVRDGDDYVLTGTKQFISGAGTSAVYVVMARTGEAGARGITAFIVPADAPGLSFGPDEHKMGWNAQPTKQVILDGVRVPAVNRLGEEGDGFGIAMRGLNGGRLGIAACSIGGAQFALERTIAYVKDRATFGAPLATRQHVMFALADMETELQAARALVAQAAAKLDAGAADAPAACAMAKRFATDAAFKVADEALQLHGGYGYLHEYGIERVVRDLRVHRILEGTNEMMRMIVGRALLGDR
ncbi:acyl-CoA dehydrogenase family protein [Agrococcus sp. HG114]|uniref:acyl-CoA dehydrogenase family protein n=1 Tax=Agrococcus sp. HG114 TaxID=2969757 RepID=UPI00215AB703|nr:acyl-CoA dehydrogenase family protein [Agrococcus sp. HG114]MCR8670565.1 acyl-CoA dehydrogenase family protein [Agrococcus sp. HG114]